MKKIRFSALFLAIALCGCSAASQKCERRSVYAMDTLMSLTAYGDHAQEALDRAAERLSELEQELSVTLPDSDIGRLNSSAGSPVEVSDDTVAILREALEISAQTGGALDVTIYPVLREWGFTTGEYSVPDSEVLSELLEKVDYTQVSISENKVSVPEGFAVDLGAAAKGYASDCAAEIMRNSGVESSVLNLGGNVCVTGSKPDGSPWKVAVADPFGGEYLGTLSVSDCFVITSGKYERYFTGEDGRRYHHIIDPATGYPSENGLSAVTVLGYSGVECDALSTALLVLGEDAAAELWRERGGFEMLLVTDDRRLVATRGFAEKFQNSSEMGLQVLEK